MQRERDEIMSTIIKAVDTTNEPAFNTGMTSDPTGNAVVKLMKHNDCTNNKIDELVDLKIQIAEEIAQLETLNHRMVLRERYIHCKKFEEIAVEMTYDYTWVIRLHGRALQEFEKAFAGELKQALKSK